MTGTGTKEDPYIVSDWEEIKTAIGEFGVYVKCVPNLIIDWNDIDPTGKLYDINMGCEEFDANGLIISGILCDLDNNASAIFKYNRSTGYINIRNLSLMNYQINSGNMFTNMTRYGFKFYNFVAVGGSVNIQACLFGNGAYTYYSYIKHDLYGIAYPFAGVVRVYHTILDIYTHGDNDNNSTLSIQGSDFILKGKYNYRVVVDTNVTRAIIDMENKKGSLTYFNSNGKRDLVVCNTDKIPLSDPNIAIGVTSAQLRDPAVLKELGFPIMGG